MTILLGTMVVEMGVPQTRIPLAERKADERDRVAHGLYFESDCISGWFATPHATL